MPRTVPTAPSHAARESVHALALDVLADLDGISRELADSIHDHVHALDEELREATFQSCRANVAGIASLLRDEADPISATVPPEAAFYARELARRQFGLDTVFAAYRFGHGRFLRFMIGRLESTALSVEALSEVTAFSSDWMITWMDTVLQGVTTVYMEEREQWVRTSAAIRAESVAAILEGRETDVQELSARLNYDLRGRHVALVLSTVQDDGSGAAADFERLAVGIAKRLGATSWLLVPQGSLRMDAWATVPEGASDPPSRIEAAAKAGVRVAVGLAQPGIAGFRASHGEALHAHRMARLTGRGAGSCTAFADVMLSSLLTQDLVRAERFVGFELGGLAADDDATRRIASTLKVFLEEGSSFVGAARRIGVHENTIAYRVRRAAELLGRPLEDRKLEVHVALRILEVLRRVPH